MNAKRTVFEDVSINIAVTGRRLRRAHAIIHQHPSCSPSVPHTNESRPHRAQPVHSNCVPLQSRTCYSFESHDSSVHQRNLSDKLVCLFDWSRFLAIDESTLHDSARGCGEAAGKINCVHRSLLAGGQAGLEKLLFSWEVEAERPDAIHLEVEPVGVFAWKVLFSRLRAWKQEKVRRSESNREWTQLLRGKHSLLEK